MVVVGSPAATIFINNCNKLITIIRIEATLPMCFKNHNSQTNSQVTTCKCIDEKTLINISFCIVLFYVLLTFMSVLVLFVFYKDVSNGLSVGYLFIFLFSLANYITIIYFYSHAEKVECKEIYDDLEDNIVYMYFSAVFTIVCLIIFTCFASDYAIRIIISVILLVYTFCIGIRVKFYNRAYALTKIDIDYMPTANKYSKIRKYVKESELLVKKKSYLKYYKEMEWNHLMILAFLAFVTSTLGVNSIISLKSASTLSALAVAM
ncbi:permease [Gardnerella piotii]|uniref:permease n=1 Tax=Gardnerella piotii TaxID=2792977 RepID=UPI002010BD72|nr:permease [Gardnerella piotii]